MATFIECHATQADHELACENSETMYMPRHHVSFYNTYLKDLEMRSLVLLLTELSELAAFLDIPVLKRFVRTRFLLLIGEEKLDSFLSAV